MPEVCLAYLLNFAQKASLADLGRQGGLSDQKVKMGFVIWVEKLKF